MKLIQKVPVAPSVGVLSSSASSGSSGPAAPSSLTVIRDGGYTNMFLEWTSNSAGAEDGFKIERSTDGSSWSQVDTVGSGITVYTDTGLTRGQIYYYRVRAYDGAENSDYSNTDNDTIFSPSEFAAELDIDPENGVFTDSAGTTPVASDGDLVRRVDNQGTVGGNFLTAVDSNRPTWQDNEVNGKATLRFATDDYIRDTNTAATNWRFLHNGTAYVFLVVWKTTSTNPGTLQFLFDTLGGASNATGLSVLMDDRGSTPRNDGVSARIGKGSSPFHAAAECHDEGARAGTWHVTAFRYDGSLGSENIQLLNDGTFGANASGDKSGSAQTGDAAGFPRIGANTTQNIFYNGDIARIYATTDVDAITDTGFQTLQEWADEEYGITSGMKFWEDEISIQYSATGDDHAAWPGICVAPNGDLVMAYNRATDHYTFDGALVVRTSSDNGATWSAESAIFDHATDGGGTRLWVVGGLGVLSNGDIILTVGARDSGAVIVDGIGYFRSTDNGATWSAIRQLTESTFAGFAAEGGAMVELANGDLLFSYYGNDTGQANNQRSCRLLRSTDGGSTWGSEVTICNGVTDGKSYGEPGLVLYGSTLYCLIRDTTSTAIRYATSNDDGATWSALTYVCVGSGRMTPIRLSTGEIVAALRNSSAANAPCAMLNFDGSRWQIGYQFATSPNFTDLQMTYGQFAELPDGTICVAYSMEASGQGVADVWFAKTA